MSNNMFYNTSNMIIENLWINESDKLIEGDNFSVSFVLITLL